MTNEQERATVVHWLRSEALTLLYKSDINPQHCHYENDIVALFADAIERAEHLAVGEAK